MSIGIRPPKTPPTASVVFLPDWSQANPYLGLLKAAIEENGYAVILRDFPHGIFSLNRTINREPGSAILHIHWINQLVGPLFWSPSTTITQLKLLLLALDVLIARLRGRKVIWTIHNLVSHESPNPALELRARRILAKTCNRVILHSQSALRQVEHTFGFNLAQKASVIAHGNFLQQYPSSPAKSRALHVKWQLDGSQIVLLMFGELRRYKGVSTVLRAFSSTKRPDLRLIIAGSCDDDELTREIKQSEAMDYRIKAALGFVENSDVAPLFSIADIAIISFERALTSGSVILAMSMGKALLLPEAARVFDVVTEDGAIFFDSQESLANKLLALQKRPLLEMGKCNSEVSKTFDWASIGGLVAATYQQ